MSSTTKMKHVVNEALQRYELPDEKHYIVKVKITPEIFFSNKEYLNNEQLFFLSSRK